MNKSSRLIRKIVVGAICLPLFVAGVVAVPLPGPGLIIMVVALFILSLEFDWANIRLNKAKA